MEIIITVDMGDMGDIITMAITMEGITDTDMEDMDMVDMDMVGMVMVEEESKRGSKPVGVGVLVRIVEMVGDSDVGAVVDVVIVMDESK